MLTLVERLVRERVHGGPIALTRVMLGLALAIMTLEGFVHLDGLASGKMTYPYVSWAAAPPSWLGTCVLLVGLVSAATLVIGLLPHVMSALGCLTCLVVLGADQQNYSSHLTLLTLLLAFLTFAEADRRWGYSTRRHGHARTAPFRPQLLIMTQVSVCYLFAGLSKTQPTFLSGHPLGGWMWPSLPDLAFVVLAWMTVVTEVGLAVLLWVPKLRVVAVATGVSLHFSIVVFLSADRLVLVAFALTAMSAYPLFLSRPRFDRATAASPASRIALSDSSS